MQDNRYKHIIIENRDKLRIIKINNPRKKNALNHDAYLGLIDALNKAKTDDNISVVAITGSDNFYSSGNDFSSNFSEAGGNELSTYLKKKNDTLRDLIRAFYDFPKLLIAVVNGPCIGIAATTAALCDVIYCSETAYFKTPFTSLGICPEGCSTYTFPRILGNSKAMEMLLLNHTLSAKEALQFNFVSEIFKQNELNSKIWPKIEEYTKLPIEAIKVTKELVRKLDHDKLEKALNLELNALSIRMQSDDFFNAVAGFFQRKSKL